MVVCIYVILRAQSFRGMYSKYRFHYALSTEGKESCSLHLTVTASLVVAITTDSRIPWRNWAREKAEAIF